ncbi:hypothetical protein DY000_02052717 [Brassica cretica]|uniref:Uncharacterized protein n=1 Tax=Brassica cretica TaxID=69181 RepID=A0ABQ7ACR6_BRACR|nr:hypothetical protein DY000_02052717 [Brassica cretica]
MTHEEFAARHPHPPSPVYVNIDRQTGPAIDRQRETAIDRQPPAAIDRRAPLTYRVHMPKIDVARLNALMPRPNPSVNPPETTSTHSDDASEPMEVDKAPMGRTLRKRKGKVAKHLKREANEKEMESFQKRVFRIPLEKPFEEAYFTHRLWMLFKETRETEEDIRRMFCESREKMKNMITLKKKSDPGKFAVPCTVEPSKESFTFVDCSQRSLGGIVRDLEVHIDVARLNALMPRPNPSVNPPETTSTHSDDASEPMEVDKAPMGRTLRKRKGKVAKHLKREANEKEMESFQKRVFRIPLEKPFEEAYFTHRLWMLFKETRETEEDIRRMFCESREKMKNMITLKKKSDPGKFAVPCTVEPSKESFTFVDCSQRSLGGIVRDLETHQLCLTLIDPHVYFNPIPVMKPRASSRRIDNPGLIAACHYGAEYETDYSASIETHSATSIDSANKKSMDIPKEESVDSSPGDWENDYYNPTLAAHTRDTIHTEEYDEDYKEERAIQYRAILDEEDRILHHSSWKRNASSIDRTISTSIDTHPYQTSQQRASTDIAYYLSIDTRVDRPREGDYSIGNWADDHHHESYAIETAIHEPGADNLFM